MIRVPAYDVEALVTEALGKVSSNAAASQVDIRNLIDRVVIGRSTIQIQLSEFAETEGGAGTSTLHWTPRPSPFRKRQIIQGAGDTETKLRPMRANARAIPWRRPPRSPGLCEPRVRPFVVPHVDLIETFVAKL